MAQARTLNEQEIEQVLEHTKTRKHAARDRCLILTSHLSGMRVGEIAALTISHVLAPNGTIRSEIRLTAEQTKGKHARTVFINQRLRDEWSAYLQTMRTDDRQRALFPSQKNPREGFSPNSLAQHFTNLYRGAEQDGCSSHTGRRSYATKISSSGIGLRVLMRLMGHRHPAVTLLYIDASDDMLRRAAELA
ncbi:MAG: tyrosine-type recombinase/integrase [Limnohabitans sp.]